MFMFSHISILEVNSLLDYTVNYVDGRNPKQPPGMKTLL